MKFGYKIEAGYAPLIREIVKATGCETYLELGIDTACTIHEIVPHCARCIGVDVQDRRGFHDFEFYKMTTDEFFKTIPMHADIIFIDADHNFDEVRKDFLHAIKILNNWGIILLHDTDPISKTYLEPRFCGDAYRVRDWIKETFPHLNILTLPISVAGLTIVNRNENRLDNGDFLS